MNKHQRRYYLRYRSRKISEANADWLFHRWIQGDRTRRIKTLKGFKPFVIIKFKL